MACGRLAFHEPFNHNTELNSFSIFVTAQTTKYYTYSKTIDGAVLIKIYTLFGKMSQVNFKTGVQR